MRKFKGFSTIEKSHTDWRLYDIDLAKRDLLNEFYTRKGERLMSPSYGSIVWDLLFDPLVPEIISAINQDCNRIVSKDPRFKLLDVQTSSAVDDSFIMVDLRLYYIPTATETDLLAVYSRISSQQRTQE